jgi:hypothetical protein
VVEYVPPQDTSQNDECTNDDEHERRFSLLPFRRPSEEFEVYGETMGQVSGSQRCSAALMRT